MTEFTAADLAAVLKRSNGPEPVLVVTGKPPEEENHTLIVTSASIQESTLVLQTRPNT